MVTRKLVVDEIEWNVIDQGEGPAILLVHGFPLDHSMWQFQLDSFCKRYRVICPDLPGYGQSTFLGKKESTTMEEMSDQLAALLNAMGVEQVAFCGLSMGGYIGWQFWARHRTRLSHLIACDTRSIADTPEVARGRRILAQGVLDHGAERVAKAMIPKLFSTTSLARNRGIISETENVIANCSPKTIALGHLAMSIRMDMTERLQEMGSISSLVIVGEYDEISSLDEMSSIARGIPGAQFHALPGAGHMAPLECPQAFNEVVLDFLSSKT